MPDMQADDAARAAQRDLVRRGYDQVSFAYRDDDGQAAASSADDVGRYAGWVAELAGLLPAGATVADLGCSAGIPATRELTGHGLRVLGVDFSAVQVARARRLVPEASLVRADITALRTAASAGGPAHAPVAPVHSGRGLWAQPHPGPRRVARSPGGNGSSPYAGDHVATVAPRAARGRP
jgi:SAM-dependent methyltransferase